MHVLILTPYRYGRTPGPRSSIELWEKVLEPHGITFEYQPFETDALAGVLYEQGAYARKAKEMTKAYLRRLRTLGSLERADAILIYREAALIGPALIERIAAHRKPIIYQLDDPLYVPYSSPFNGRLSYLKFFGKVGSICKLSTVTVVNSKHHAEYARESGAKRIIDIPSVVDADVFHPRIKPEGSSVPTIGWTGSPSTAPNLKLIAEPLRRVAESGEAEVAIMGAGAESPLPEVPARLIRWSAETEIDEAARFDIGLLPLPRTPWNERSFFLKLVQYMALGIPTVATPMGSVDYVLQEGRTGFTASNDDDWERRLLQLAGDADLRAELGARAADIAAERYTLQANADRILSVFEAIP